MLKVPKETKDGVGTRDAGVKWDKEDKLENKVTMDLLEG